MEHVNSREAQKNPYTPHRGGVTIIIYSGISLIRTRYKAVNTGTWNEKMDILGFEYQQANK